MPSKEAKQRLYHKRKNEGICPRCGKQPKTDTTVYCDSCRDYTRILSQKESHKEAAREYSRNWSRNHPELRRERARNYGLKTRRLVYDAYGNKCVCCGESEEKFLSLDHINRDGQQHRKTAGNSTQYYRTIIKEGFPDTMQLLCFNCHMAKDFRGGCPHQIRETVLG